MTPQDILDFLKEREGFTNKVYKDTRGILTVGLGHKLTREERNHCGLGATLADAQLQTWAQADSAKAYEAALSQAAELGITDSEFIKVLTSVNFQLGTAWNTEFAATWGMLKNHEWEHAAEHLNLSLWAKQTPVRVKDFQAVILSQAHKETAPVESAPEIESDTQKNANQTNDNA